MIGRVFYVCKKCVNEKGKVNRPLGFCIDEEEVDDGDFLIGGSMDEHVAWHGMQLFKSVFSISILKRVCVRLNCLRGGEGGISLIDGSSLRAK